MVAVNDDMRDAVDGITADEYGAIAMAARENSELNGAIVEALEERAR